MSSQYTNRLVSKEAALYQPYVMKCMCVAYVTVLIYLILIFQEDKIFERAKSISAIWTMWTHYEKLCYGHVSIQFKMSFPLDRNLTKNERLNS